MITFLRHRRALAAVFLSAGLAATVAGCGGGSASSLPKGVAVTVNGQPINVTVVDRQLAQTKGNAKAQGTTFPKEGTDAYDQVVQQTIKYLVQKAELEQQAKKENATVTDAQVEIRLKALIKQYFGGDHAKYLVEIKKRGVTDAQVRDDVRLQLLQTALVGKITGKVKVDEAEAREFYLQHATDFANPQSRDVAHILVKTKALADTIYAKLEKGADFAAEAKKSSIDTGTKSKGGDFTATLGRDDPAFDKVAFALKTGEISKPVKSQFGWHVIKAIGVVKPRQVIPFEKAKASIIQQLLQSKKTAEVTRWTDATQVFYATRIKYAKDYAPPATTSTSPTTSIIPTAPAPTG